MATGKRPAWSIPVHSVTPCPTAPRLQGASCILQTPKAEPLPSLHASSCAPVPSAILQHCSPGSPFPTLPISPRGNAYRGFASRAAARQTQGPKDGDLILRCQSISAAAWAAKLSVPRHDGGGCTQGWLRHQKGHLRDARCCWRDVGQLWQVPVPLQEPRCVSPKQKPPGTGQPGGKAVAWEAFPEGMGKEGHSQPSGARQFSPPSPPIPLLQPLPTTLPKVTGRGRVAFSLSTNVLPQS